MSKIDITMVAAMAEGRVIGKDGLMPWNIPEDYKHFKALTVGKPCIMGRKTFESILKELGKPLPGRPSIVISRGGFAHEGAIVVPSLEAGLEKARALLAEMGGDEICIIGGGQIYAQALSVASVLELTHIAAAFDGDAYFPAFDPQQWREVSRRPNPGPPAFDFVRYERG